MMECHRRKPEVNSRALHDLVRRIFPDVTASAITRTTESTTTQVYRIERAGARFYLCVAEDREDRFAREVFVYDLLVARGVRVPHVIHYEPFDEAPDRSVMVTTEIPGLALLEP